MKPAATLKDLLKPPFFRNTSSCRDIYCKTQLDTERTGVLEIDISGRSSFSYREGGVQLWEEIIEFVVNALNEKWERDFGEPLRWKFIGNYWYECEKCGAQYQMIGSKHDHCPHCGQRLFPPEEAQNG